MLELLEESSDELPSISDLDKKTNEVLSSDGKDKNEILEKKYNELNTTHNQFLKSKELESFM